MCAFLSLPMPQAQMWFEQGYNLLYDFWDYEADRAFEAIHPVRCQLRHVLLGSLPVGDL